MSGEQKLLDRRRFLAATGMAGAMSITAAAQGKVVAASSEGAVADGRTLNTVALQRAIDRAHEAGGGVVVLTPGVYLSGGLQLRSNVTLRLEAGSELLGSPRTEDYQYHPGPAEEGDANGRHLIFAIDAENIAVEGLGTIDGNGAHFWHRKGRPQAKPEDMWADVVAWDYEAATPRRPAPMLEFARCRNVRVEGVTLANAPSWTMRPIACESVWIHGVRVRNPIFAPNTDGMDITASRNVFISDCDIATGDDAICIKSENPYGELLPTKNITITNCVFTTCCNGLKLGTATYGRFENITFSNSVIYNEASSPLNERVIAGIALEMVDGGSIEGVAISNIVMENVRTPLFVRLGERHKGRGSFVRDIKISGIQARGALLTSSIMGVEGMPVENVSLRDISIATVEKGERKWAHGMPPEMREFYPEARMFGRLPAAGLYVRHAKGISVSAFSLNSETPDPRPVIATEDVSDVELLHVKASAAAEGEPLLRLRNTQNAWVSGTRAPAGTAVFVEVAGATSSGIALHGNETSSAAKVVAFAENAKAEAVTGA
ncbi:glycoside hydrolase family 28 protein [Granulicella cerasi]|uniref:Glycoside hydrolase family 28 protein n=1 Tax=Granulicella cerasi TaxID=741063 RepID=A0ABW1Z3P3_9BACT|nr:glycoside hydrolase family 28 protein [Granulicella cerasi]